MADMEVAEQSAMPIPRAEHRCSVQMSNDQPCGRPIHTAPSSVDKEPVCSMHSHDPNKSDDAFQHEFERILAAAGDGVADLTGFVFPSARYSGRIFKAECNFYWATFIHDASFGGATFTRDAGFGGATFLQGADFRR